MNEEILNELEKEMMYIASVPHQPEDEATARMQTLIVRFTWKEIFRLARVGLKEEERQMGLS